MVTGGKINITTISHTDKNTVQPKTQPQLLMLQP